MSSLPDLTTGSTRCTQNAEPGSCPWTFAKGSTVVLTAVPAGTAGASLAGWSTPECPGTGSCRLTLDDDRTIVALFSRLTLSVVTSGSQGDVITSTPPGIRCPDVCAADFDAKSTVVLTVRTGAGSTLTSFPFGCASVGAATCSVRMLDQPQSVGAKFNGASGPGPPDVVSVSLKVAKTGDGSGRVTATGLDCGNACSAQFPYGGLAQLTAAPDGGSYFGGWGGVCASDSDPVCSLPVGPVTLVSPRFSKAGAPGQPGPLSLSVDGTSVTLGWGASDSVLGVKSYEVSVPGGPAPLASTSATTATVGGLACGTAFTFSVVAVDAVGNRSAPRTGAATTAACPLKVRFLSRSVTPGTRPKLTIRLTATAAARGSQTLLVNGKQVVRRAVSLHAGTNALAFRLPKGKGRRDARLVLRLVDPATGPRKLAFRVVVHT